MAIRCPECGEDEHLVAWPELDDGKRPTACETCGERWVREPAPHWRPPARRAVFVRTSELDLVAIKDAAWRIAEQRIAEGWAVSKRDAILRHGMGLYGEHAVTHYLNRQGFTVRSIAEDWQAILDRLGDLEVVSPDGGVVVRLEVKTTTLRAWVVRGPAQIKPMRADAVVWCSIPDDPAPRTVRLLGCSLLPLDDARRPTLRDTQALSPWIRGRWAGQG